MNRDLVNVLSFLTGMTVFFVISVHREREMRRSLLQDQTSSRDTEVSGQTVSREREVNSEVRDKILSVQSSYGKNFSFDAQGNEGKQQDQRETGAERIVKVVLLSMGRLGEHTKR